MSVLLRAVSFAIIPCLATLAAAVVATFRRPGAKLQRLVQHFAAGVVLSAAAGEILPDIRASHRMPELVIGFAGGVILLLVIRASAEDDEKAEGLDRRSPFALLTTVAVDVFLDGALIGLGFATGERAGLLLTVALTLELLFLGLSTAASLGNIGLSRWRVVSLLTGLCGLLLLGTAAGAALLGSLPPAGLVVALSFGLAALLFLVVEELLVEAHEVEETPWSTAAFFMGFLCLTALEMGS